MVNLSEIFLGAVMLEVQSGVGIKDIGWTRMSSIDMGKGCCYW